MPDHGSTTTLPFQRILGAAPAAEDRYALPFRAIGIDEKSTIYRGEPYYFCSAEWATGSRPHRSNLRAIGPTSAEGSRHHAA